MTVVGKFVKKFSEANMALAVDVHMNGDYEFYFDVLKVYPDSVTVKGRKEGKERRSTIERDGDWECFYYKHRGVYQRIFGAKAERVKVMPFVDEGRKTCGGGAVK